jgi:hypothetical protein
MNPSSAFDAPEATVAISSPHYGVTGLPGLPSRRWSKGAAADRNEGVDLADAFPLMSE